MRELTNLWLFGSHAVTAATVLGLFWAATARPSRVRKPTAFRLSALLTGASFVANVAIPIILVSIPRDDRGGSHEPWAALYLFTIPPLLIMVAIYLGIDSVMERRDDTETQP